MGEGNIALSELRATYHSYHPWEGYQPQKGHTLNKTSKPCNANNNTSLNATVNVEKASITSPQSTYCTRMHYYWNKALRCTVWCASANTNLHQPQPVKTAITEYNGHAKCHGIAVCKLIMNWDIREHKQLGNTNTWRSCEVLSHVESHSEARCWGTDGWDNPFLQMCHRRHYQPQWTARCNDRDSWTTSGPSRHRRPYTHILQVSAVLFLASKGNGKSLGTW